MTRDDGRAPARARLATLMDERRRELRLTWDQVAARAGVHRETLRQIRNGSGSLRPLTSTGIEDALEWEHGSIDAILTNGNPTPTVEVGNAGQHSDEDMTRDELIAKAESLMAEANEYLRRARGETG